MSSLLNPNHQSIPQVEPPLETTNTSSDSSNSIAPMINDNQTESQFQYENQSQNQRHKYNTSVSSYRSTQTIPSTPITSSVAPNPNQSMTPTSNKPPPSSPKVKKICFRCTEPISGQFVRALNQCWHMDCFTCYDCTVPCSQKFFPVSHSENNNNKNYGNSNSREQRLIADNHSSDQLTDQNAPYASLDHIPLCETCYFRRLDLLCHSCDGALRSSYITAINHKYHVEHFTCSMCNTLFGVEDSYYEHQDSIYCLYHYSTLFATKCSGCYMPILKQFVEIFRNGKQQQWHPECYMIHKFWNVRMSTADAPPGLAIENQTQLEGLASEGTASAKAQLLHKQQSIEEKIIKIWTSLCAFEESTAACISDMLQFSSSVKYSKALDATTRLTDKIQILFSALDGLFTSIVEQQAHYQNQAKIEGEPQNHWFDNFGPLETYYIGKEPKTLCKKLVNFMSLISKAKENEILPLKSGGPVTPMGSAASKDSARKFTRDLLSLVTSLAHCLKLLIRLGLNGALQWGQLASQAKQNLQDSSYEIDADEPLHIFLDLTDKHRDTSTLSTLSISNSGFINGKTTDQCTLCAKSIETESIRHALYYTKRWHMDCFNCSKCQKKLANYMKPESNLYRSNSDATDIAQSSTDSNHSVVKIWWSNTDEIIICFECFDSIGDEEKLALTPSPFALVSRLDQFTYLLRIALERLRIILFKYDEKQNRLLNQGSNAASGSKKSMVPTVGQSYSQDNYECQFPSRDRPLTQTRDQLPSSSSRINQQPQDQQQNRHQQYFSNDNQNQGQNREQYHEQQQQPQRQQHSQLQNKSVNQAMESPSLQQQEEQQENREQQKQYRQQNQGYMTTLTDIRRLRSTRTDDKVSDSKRQAAFGNNLVHMSESQEALVRPGNSRSASANNGGPEIRETGEEELDFSDTRPSIRRDQSRGYNKITDIGNQDRSASQSREPNRLEHSNDRTHKPYHHLLAKPQQYLPSRLRSQPQPQPNKERNQSDSINNRQGPTSSYQKSHLDRTTDLLTNDALTLDDIPRIVAAEEAREQRPNAFRHHDPTVQRGKRINTRSVSSVKASPSAIPESKSFRTINNRDSNGHLLVNANHSNNHSQISGSNETSLGGLEVSSNPPFDRNHGHSISGSSTTGSSNVINTTGINLKTGFTRSKYISEFSASDIFLLRHIAVVRLYEIVHESFTMEELLSLIETRKAPSFWNKMGKAFGGDKGAQPAEIVGATHGVFGVTLESLVDQYGVYSTLGVGPSKLKIPSFVDDCISAMRQMDMSVEGVFRKNGNIRRLKQLTESINDNPESSSTVSSENPVQLAALFKKFLRELPDPLLTFKLQKLFVVSQKLDSYEDRLKVLHLCCVLLPRAHRDTMEVIFFFLKWVASFSHIDKESGSKMDVHNLATVITPNILHARLTTTERERDKEYVVAGDPGSSGGGSDYGDAYFLSIEAVNTLIDNNDEFSQIPNSLLLILNDPEVGILQNNATDSSSNVSTAKSPKIATGTTAKDFTTKEIIARIEKFVQSDSGREKLRYLDEVENMDYEDSSGVEFIVNEINQGIPLAVETDIN